MRISSIFLCFVVLGLFFSGVFLSCKNLPDQITFTVKFDTQEGSAVKSQVVEKGKKATKPTDPTRTGYAFGGWYADKGFTKSFDFNTNITANITLYAKWTPLVAFTVKFDTQEGSSVPSQTVAKGQKATKPADPTRTGYNFAGWYRDSTVSLTFNFDEDTITSDITLYAGWGVVISDANFRVKLKAKVPNAFIGDLLITRRRDVTELKSLDVSGLNGAKITSLSGIEYFISLTALDCSFNSLTSLNVSKNVSLTTLNCFSTGLTSLDVSKNLSLTSLSCSSNSLTSLDVSKNVSLTSLSCSSNSLTSLDVSKNVSLTSLSCVGNSLTTLDVSTNVSLTTLDCSSTALTTLDVSKNLSLTSLNCSSNRLTTLDVSKNVSLAFLGCSENPLEFLDVLQNPSLKGLICNNNPLTTLDVSQNRVLDSLICFSTGLMMLDVSTNVALTTLNCSGTGLTELDVSTNVSLTSLSCSENSLTSLDMRGMRSARVLSVNAGVEAKNPITELKVHDALKNHAEIKEAKTNRGSNITIPTYSAASGSTSYTLTCTNYDPNGNAGAGICIQGP